MDDLHAKHDQAMAAIDAANAADPRSETFQGEPWPKELLYGHRMSRWLEVLRPDAPEPLRLAARAQHIRRWEVPRDSYPRDRKGYHQWRTRLYGYHADRTEEILAELGYDAAIIARVRDLLMKKRIKNDPDMQTLEDVICLVFLENYFADFAREHDEAKLMTILQRTWGKMSEQGHHAALRLDLPDEARALVEKALAGG